MSASAAGLACWCGDLLYSFALHCSSSSSSPTSSALSSTSSSQTYYSLYSPPPSSSFPNFSSGALLDFARDNSLALCVTAYALASFAAARLPRVFCARAKPLSRTLRDCTGYAHRGGRETTIENTLEAFKAGYSTLGGIELDVVGD